MRDGSRSILPWRRNGNVPPVTEAQAANTTLAQPDVDKEAHVDGHAFDPPEDRPWGLCTVCNFSLSAHLDPGPGYSPPDDLPYVPPTAVQAREAGRR